MPVPVPPTGTYRLQLRREFGFRDAAAVVGYLADLGVSHVYCSPVMTATPGSAHGYDVVSHERMSDELGGEPGWAELVAACREHGLGLVVDIVPNHMAVPVPESLNAALWDVLRHGAASSYAEWFDVDWDAGDGRLLMPVLGQPLDACLRDGEITVDGDTLRYYDHAFPLAPGTEKLVDDPAAADLLALLDAQHYRLAFWRVADDELNYRRFFDVTTLIGVRVEVPEVFDATHARVLRAVRDGEIDGLRIDHPDGLADPGRYLDRLADASGGTWTVVEKILEGNEELLSAWRTAGTTGYDALAAVTQLFVDPAGEQPLTDLYTSLTGMPADFEEVVDAGKRLAVGRLLGAEVERLVRDARRVQPDDVTGRDLTARGLREAIAELLVSFHVYRAYTGDPASRTRTEDALGRALARLPRRDRELRWVVSLLLADDPSPAVSALATRFAQTTGPATAKGVEDTAFYRWHRLVGLNEVGNDPAHFARTPAAFDDYAGRLARDWPGTMTTLSTHDTKRSEDVRARLLVLAEIPREWGDTVTAWRAAAAHLPPVDANTDYLLWQTLVGAWPIDADRLSSYLEKATREAKLQTSWTDPDADFDRRLRERVAAVLADDSLTGAVARFVDEHLTAPGRSNALAQKLVQLTMPGVPDVYQGEELESLALVDPDNRRPVDYDRRRRALAGLDDGQPLPDWRHDDTPKLLVTARTMRLRRDRPETFRGGYGPVAATGAAAAHAVAFTRGEGQDAVVTVATRLPVGLARAGGWRDTRVELPAGRWRDVFAGREADGELASMLADLPVALLVRADG